ncbi:glutamate cyclase domain-containing protein [Indioceanicola profundi]|uniref:glutamate cyclase domain-containing protein n=1 Tax=Indioceanicola profundi TaxID=2220096 RepID=UPI000E6AE1D4|nr:glutamate cyclase domain-containing protein [Indioceanicola profundi]
MEKSVLTDVGVRLHCLSNLDISGRGSVDQLAQAAWEAQGGPPCLLAAQRLLEQCRAGRAVFLASGWHDRQGVNSRIAETDGPPGAAVLGLALHKATGAIPVFLTEEDLIGPISQVVRAAGLSTLRIEEAVAGMKKAPSPIHGAAVLRFPRNRQEAEAHADHLLNAYEPTALISVEVGGEDSEGEIHTFRGTPATEATPKFDALFRKARDRCLLTVGIGDGGNELGFGSIRDQLGGVLSRAAEKVGRDPAPVTKVEVLVTAAVSNWGAYAVAACLAAASGNLDLLHTPDAESRLLTASADAGLIDGMSGYTTPSADGMPLAVHRGVLTLMGEIVRQATG